MFSTQASKRQRIGEIAPPVTKTTQCKCGNTFKEDSVYCRKCGAVRPGSVEERKRAVSPAAVESSAKSARPNQTLAEMVLSVASAMETAHRRSDASRHMLNHMVPYALGPPTNQRSEFQKEGVPIIGKGLHDHKDELSDRVAKAEKLANSAAEVANLANAKKQAADRAVKCAEDDRVAKEEALKKAELSVHNKYDTKAKALAALGKATAEYDSAFAEKKRLDDIYEQHFVPIKKGCRDESVALQHVQACMPVLDEGKIEPCLKAAFKEAAIHCIDRGTWCVRSIDEAENIFNTVRKAALDILNRARDAMDAAKREADRASKALDDAERLKKVAEDRVKAAEKTLADAEDAALTANYEKDDANRKLASANDVLGSKKKDMDDFNNGPLSDYDYLKSHNETGYDPCSHPEKDGSHLAKDLDDKHRVNDVHGDLQDALVDEHSKKLLSGMVPGAFGPKGKDRDPLQKQGVDMIKRALEPKIKDLEKRLDELVPRLGKTNTGLTTQKLLDVLKNDPVTGPALADQIVDEKSKALADAVAETRKRCDVDVGAAKKFLADAEGALVIAKTDLDDAESILMKHFVPLRDGKSFGKSLGDRCPCGNTFMPDAMFCRKCGSKRPEIGCQPLTPAEIAEHLTALQPFFDRWEMEDCLKAAFNPAASKTPSERRDFCKKVVAEVDIFFVHPKKVLKDKVDMVEAAVLKAKRELERALKACSNAKAEEAKAASELEVAKEVRRTVNELVGYKSRYNKIHRET